MMSEEFVLQIIAELQRLNDKLDTFLIEFEKRKIGMQAELAQELPRLDLPGYSRSDK